MKSTLILVFFLSQYLNLCSQSNTKNKVHFNYYFSSGYQFSLLVNNPNFIIDGIKSNYNFQGGLALSKQIKRQNKFSINIGLEYLKITEGVYAELARAIAIPNKYELNDPLYNPNICIYSYYSSNKAYINLDLIYKWKFKEEFPLNIILGVGPKVSLNNKINHITHDNEIKRETIRFSTLSINTQLGVGYDFRKFGLDITYNYIHQFLKSNNKSNNYQLKFELLSLRITKGITKT